MSGHPLSNAIKLSLPAAVQFLKKSEIIAFFAEIQSPNPPYGDLYTFFKQPASGICTPLPKWLKRPPALAKPDLVVYITVKAG